MRPDLLRAERIQRGWSQAKLAEEVGVDTRTVRRWEQGKAIPFPYYRKQLVTLLGKTAEELGLPSDSDEDNAVEQASSLVAQPITPETPALTEPLPNLAAPTTPSLHTTIAICDQQLSPQAQAALHALAAFAPKPSSFSEEEALAVSQQPVETLDELCDAGLLESCESGRYSLRQTIVDYARTLGEVPATQEQQADSVVSDLQLHQQQTHLSSTTTFSLRDRDIHLHQQEMHSLIATLSLHLSHWKASFQKEELPTPQPFKRFLPRSLLIVSVILLAVVITIAVLPTFHRQPSPKSTPGQDNYGPPSYTLTIPTVDPSLQKTARHLQQAFKAVYPQLVNRFALNPATAPRNVTLTFSSDLSSPAATSDTTITLSPDWMRQHPNDVGLLTHELTLTLERYPSGTPAWFADGMADYARSVYGPADDDWSLPDGVKPQDSYTKGGAVAARFLLWLEQYTTLNIVDQLNHALQTKQSFSVVFQRLAGHTVDKLWSQYKAYPVITLLPEQLYKTVTSRKPVYQSSFRVQNSEPGTFSTSFAQGLYMSNFAMQADMTIIHGDGGGFIFRSDANHRVNVRLRVSPNGTYDLVNQTHSLISSSSSAIKEGQNQTNRLTIIVQKYTIYLYINNQFIEQVEDSSSMYGSIGMMALNWGNTADVRFEKVQVF